MLFRVLKLHGDSLQPLPHESFAFWLINHTQSASKKQANDATFELSYTVLLQSRYSLLTVERFFLLSLLDHVKQSGGKVLVHCEAGISRSPTICMAYIMRTQRLRLEAAFDIIKQRRDVISPNFSFMGQLQQFESEVLSTAPTHAVTPEPATTCAPESASFFANDFTATFSTKNFEPPVFTLPTSCLQAPVHHQFKLSPITALP